MKTLGVFGVDSNYEEGRQQRGAPYVNSGVESRRDFGVDGRRSIQGEDRSPDLFLSSPTPGKSTYHSTTRNWHESSVCPESPRSNRATQGLNEKTKTGNRTTEDAKADQIRHLPRSTRPEQRSI